MICTCYLQNMPNVKFSMAAKGWILAHEKGTQRAVTSSLQLRYLTHLGCKGRWQSQRTFDECFRVFACQERLWPEGQEGLSQGGDPQAQGAARVLKPGFGSFVATRLGVCEGSRLSGSLLRGRCSSMPSTCRWSCRQLQGIPSGKPCRHQAHRAGW